MRHIHTGWSKAGDEIPQPTGVVLGGNLRQNAEPPRPTKQPSPMQLEERERLVAEGKRHHPEATTGGTQASGGLGGIVHSARPWSADTFWSSGFAKAAFMVWVWLVTTSCVIATFVTTKLRGSKKMPPALRDAIAADAIFGTFLLIRALL